MIHEQRDALFGAIGYKPTAAQLEILNDDARFKLVAGGVRAGKSNLGAMYMFEKIMSKIVEDPDAATHLIEPNVSPTSAVLTIKPSNSA